MFQHSRPASENELRPLYDIPADEQINNIKKVMYFNALFIGIILIVLIIMYSTDDQSSSNIKFTNQTINNITLIINSIKNITNNTKSFPEY